MIDGYPKPIRVCSVEKLRDTWKRNYNKNFKNKASGIDSVSAIDYHKNLEDNIGHLNSRIRNKSYKHKPLRPIVFDKEDGAKRIICVPTVEDRLVQRRLLEFLRDGDKLGVINKSSFGFRKNSGVKDAVNKAKNLRNERTWALKADISSFFDTIPRDAMHVKIRRRLQRSSVVPILQQVVETEEKSVSRQQRYEIREAGLEKGKGLRQGMPLSPVLSNVFLSDFDKWCEKKRINLVRYADDFVIFASSEEEIFRIHDEVSSKLNDIGLDLSKNKTYIRRPEHSVEFLGYNISRLGKSKQYVPTIPDRVFENTRCRLQEFSDVDMLLRDYGSLSKSVRVLDTVYRSYLAAYDGAHNLDDYKNVLADNRRNVMKTILKTIFGKESVSMLNEEMLEFICR